MNLPRPFLLNLLVYATVGITAFAGCWLYAYLHRTTPDQRLAALENELRPKGGEIFKTALNGKPIVFLLLDCSLYVLDTSGTEIERTKVLRTGFYFGLDSCTGQSIKIDGDYVKVYLANLAIGAGGGNTSGGHYRSKDGLNWEKQTDQGWKTIQEARQ